MQLDYERVPCFPLTFSRGLFTCPAALSGGQAVVPQDVSADSDAPANDEGQKHSDSRQDPVVAVDQQPSTKPVSAPAPGAGCSAAADSSQPGDGDIEQQRLAQHVEQEGQPGEAARRSLPETLSMLLHLQPAFATHALQHVQLPHE